MHMNLSLLYYKQHGSMKRSPNVTGRRRSASSRTRMFFRSSNPIANDDNQPFPANNAGRCRPERMDALDVVIVTGDAYVDHPSYGASVIGRVLEHAGFRVGMIAEPDWHSSRDFARLGKPRLFFAVTAGTSIRWLRITRRTRCRARKTSMRPTNARGCAPTGRRSFMPTGCARHFPASGS